MQTMIFLLLGCRSVPVANKDGTITDSSDTDMVDTTDGQMDENDPTNSTEPKKV